MKVISKGIFVFVTILLIYCCGNAFAQEEESEEVELSEETSFEETFEVEIRSLTFYETKVSLVDEQSNADTIVKNLSSASPIEKIVLNKGEKRFLRAGTSNPIIITEITGPERICFGLDYSNNTYFARTLKHGPDTDEDCVIDSEDQCPGVIFNAGDNGCPTLLYGENGYPSLSSLVILAGRYIDSGSNSSNLYVKVVVPIDTGSVTKDDFFEKAFESYIGFRRKLKETFYDEVYNKAFLYPIYTSEGRVEIVTKDRLEKEKFDFEKAHANNKRVDDILDQKEDLVKWGDGMLGLSFVPVFLSGDTPTDYPLTFSFFWNRDNPWIYNLEFGVGITSKKNLSISTGINAYYNMGIKVFHGKLLFGLGPYWQGLGFDGTTLIEHVLSLKTSLLAYNILWKRFSINSFVLLGNHYKKAVLHYSTMDDETKWLDSEFVYGCGIGIMYGY